MKIKTESHSPAFPNPNGLPGLTKREYFAAMAMQSAVAEEIRLIYEKNKTNGTFGTAQEDEHCMHVAAIQAIDAADALIEMLNEKEAA